MVHNQNTGFLFEIAALGPKFAWTRLAVDIPGIIIIAWVLTRMISHEEKEEIYQKPKPFDCLENQPYSFLERKAGRYA